MPKGLLVCLFPFACLCLLAAPASGQTYTEENVTTWLIPVAWNMMQAQTTEIYVPTGQLPPNFVYTRVTGMSLVVLSDPPANGSPAYITPLVKLYMPGSTNPATSGIGGNFSLECVTTPYCYLEIDRGIDGSSYFQNANYDNPAANRMYLKLDYLP